MIASNLRMAKIIDSLYLQSDSSEQIYFDNNMLDFNSSVATDIPDLSLTTTCKYNVIITAFLSIESNKDMEVSLSIAVNGITRIDSVEPKYIKRKKLVGIGISNYKLSGLNKNDVVTIQINTNGKDCDLLGVRRLFFSRWV